MAANDKPSSEEIATQLITLVQADLVSTMSMMAAVLEAVRKAGDAKLLENAREGSDQLRLECNKWKPAPQKAEDKETAKATVAKLFEATSK